MAPAAPDVGSSIRRLELSAYRDVGLGGKCCRGQCGRDRNGTCECQRLENRCHSSSSCWAFFIVVRNLAFCNAAYQAPSRSLSDSAMTLAESIISSTADIFVRLVGQVEDARAIGDAVLQLADAVDMLLVIGTRRNDVLRAFKTSTCSMDFETDCTTGASLFGHGGRDVPQLLQIVGETVTLRLQPFPGCRQFPGARRRGFPR